MAALRVDVGEEIRMTRFFRSTATALSLALLLAGSARALPPEQRSGQAGPAVLVERFQGWLASLWPSRPLSIWEEAGSIMDPDGRDDALPEGPGADAGLIMDPDG